MTFHTLLDTVPTQTKDYPIHINGLRVWDYKEVSDSKIYLISENLFENNFDEYVGFNELSKFIHTSALIPYAIHLFCEHTGENLTTYKWNSDHLLLSF